MKSPVILFVLCSFICISLHAQTGSSKADTEQADSLFTLTRKLVSRGKQDSATLVIGQGLSLAEKMGRDSFLCKFYLEQANLVNLRGDKKAGLQILLGQVAPRLSATTSYGIRDKYYNLIGTCYRTLLKYDSAIHYFREDEKLNNIHNPYGNWLVYYQMALTFMVADLPGQAEQYFRRSYAITKPAGRRIDHGVLLSEYAGFLSKRNMPDKFAAILSEYHAFIRAGKKDFSFDPIHSMLWVDFADNTLEGKVKFMTSVKQSLLNNGDTFNAAYANNYIARSFFSD